MAAGGREGGGRLRGAATFVVVLAIVASGIVVGRSIGTTIEAGVAADVPTRTVTRAEPVLGPRAGFYWGAYRDNAPYLRSLVTDLETDAASRPALLMWYHEWHGASSFPAAEAAWLAARGTVPVVSWEPWRPPAVFGDLVVTQRRYRLSEIAGGAFDRYITRYAGEIRDYGGPLMLRPFHEMDGNWYPWGGLVNGNTPADFIAAWRHVHDLFRRAGATNVTWVWSVNHVSVPDTAANAIANYWPGDAYVDWTAISGFNWGRASPLSVWKGIDAVIGARYAELQRYGKPIALMETGAPEVGGNKAEWITDTYARLLAGYPGIDAVIWYDRRDSDARDWRIDSSGAATVAFRRAVSRAGVFAADRAFRTTVAGSSRGTAPFTDGFARTVAGSWGSVGSRRWTCTTTVGDDATYRVDGSQAIARAPEGESAATCLVDGAYADVDVRATISLSGLGVAPARNHAQVVVRARDPSNLYAFTVEPGRDGRAIARIMRAVEGRFSEVASAQLPFAAEAGARYTIAGSATTTDKGVLLTMRAWPEGASPPVAPTVRATDGARERLARGRAGVRFVVADGPSIVTFDEVSVR